MKPLSAPMGNFTLRVGHKNAAGDQPAAAGLEARRDGVDLQQ